MTRDIFSAPGPRDVIDRMLLDYAAGVLCPEDSLLVAALLALDGRARAAVARYETLGGRVIEDERPASVRCLEAVMRGIDAPPAPSAEPARPRVPPALAALLGGCVRDDAACWSAACTGVERIEVKVCTVSAPRRNLFLLRLAPHAAMVPHAHAGPEITLVLEGEYDDGFGRYRRGDVAVIADDRIAHSPRAGADGCLCLVMAHGPLRPLSAVTRLVAFLTRR
jgi:putative transcriptional regulator